jgi:hypothetical protein
LLRKIGEGRLDVRVRAAIDNNEPLAEVARRLLHVLCLPLSLRTVLIHKQRDHLGLGNELPQ